MADIAEQASEGPQSASGQRRLAVLGSPIAHSQSPALHDAAYARLGLDMRYETADVREEQLASFIDSCGPEWRGLSLTMPLKKAVMPLLEHADQVATVTGTANTLLFDEAPGDADAGAAGPAAPVSGRVLRGFNTDVAGIVRALAAADVGAARYVHILGGGATAASAVMAAAELGAEQVMLSVRSLERAVWLEPLAHSLGMGVAIRPIGIADRTLAVPDVVISTLPGGTRTGALFTASTRRHALLLDVAYDPWPSELALAWAEVGGRVLSGLAMLTHQALLQVRVFVNGDPLAPLPDEDAVLADMLAAVGLTPHAG
ncbi:shikimate dehydrogenase [Microbacterium sp. STN6]|uniref:shikimate dehydrogenase family protein n=1 Tax=Microbacterium sp. STN6 TaxID=2995588 RepID=UPI0022609BC2|nr:shikimate dehydrogenase [Microbacterium sp. STN6]MCX7521703.1 shikimate dehydrogenase [Microbacterium sp. STN6]